MLDATAGYGAALSRDLQDWREQAQAVLLKVTQHQREYDALMKKILAAEVLLGQAVDSANAHPQSIRSLIREVMADGHIRTPKDVRQALAAAGHKVPTSSGSFYTTLLRMVEDSELAKDDQSRYWDPTKSRGPTTLEDMMK